MAAIVKKGSAKWSGGLKDGKGKVSTQSGALSDQDYGFAIRFEGKTGTNPEELIGAAHASCFTMALSKALEEAGHVAESLETVAAVSLDGGAITKSELTLTANVPGMDKDTFLKVAEGAKANCPISKLLNAEITLDATLV